MAKDSIDYALGELKADTLANTKAIGTLKTDMKSMGEFVQELKGGWKSIKFVLLFLSGGVLLDVGKIIYSILSK